MFLNRIYRLSSTTITRSISIARPIPKPTNNVPDVETFLKLIGRNCVEFKDTYENKWDNLFLWDGPVLKEKGVPIQQRKYILSQVQNFRISGDQSIKEVKKGKKSFFGGERKRKAFKARWIAIARSERKEQ
ncbi:mitochondrial 37S ribosomal protein mS41 FYV4 PWA37_004551 [Arxiozyma heterogenica]|uniref:Small ribosomal subunit protein mS41 n=1 Tax=Arxiozyma heterogenica TaxID=278026 RepID=A0AAN7WJR9_9SACH|nr:hypothetical protein RI543_000840 [Kazachstania heterogenica]